MGLLWRAQPKEYFKTRTYIERKDTKLTNPYLLKQGDSIMRVFQGLYVMEVYCTQLSKFQLLHNSGILETTIMIE